MSLTRIEYEQEYVNALAHLRQTGHQVGTPYRSHGLRLVRVDKFSWTDDVVFEEVWGKYRAAAMASPELFDRSYKTTARETTSVTSRRIGMPR